VSLLGLLLEGCADGVGAGGCIAGAYRDLFCGAIGLTVMINTILYLANDAVDVLLAVICLAAAILVFHFLFISLSVGCC
jgi:hypothetical protein